MRIQKSLYAVVLSLTLFAPAAFAATDPNLMEFEAIRAQQAEIRAGVESRTGIYKDLSSSDREQLLDKQRFVLATIDGKQSASDLNPQQKDSVFNSLEQIEAIINRAEDDRLVCQQVKQTGSNRKTRVCRTVAQMREDRERAERDMQNHGTRTN
jgi:hypothetical protein